MNPNPERERERLESEGLPLLAGFMMHQDTITWTALSVFLAAEVLLIGFSYQFRVPFLAIIGFLMTVVSFLILARSDTYLNKYYDLAKARVHRDDLSIFDVNVSGIPTVYLLVALHTVLAIFWIGLYAYLFQA